MIADKVSSVQTTGNCLNLSLTKATTRTFVTNFHLVENLKQPPQTGQGIHIFFLLPTLCHPGRTTVNINLGLSYKVPIQPLLIQFRVQGYWTLF